MPARTFPNLGLKAGYASGESGWGDDMTLNILKLSILTQGVVIDRVAALPGSPAAGDVYLLDETHGTHPNEVAVFDGPTGAEDWVYVAPVEGWLLFNTAAGVYEKFDGTVWAAFSTASQSSLVVACSDLTSSITAGVNKENFRFPYGFTLTEVRANCRTAPTGADIIIDINVAGATILSTKLSIDAGERTSVTAATPAVISAPSIPDDSEVTIDFDQVGSTIAGAGVKVAFIGVVTA